MNEQSLNELHRFYSLWRENNAIYDKWAKAHGLSSNELLFLYSLYEADNHCTQREISQRWFIPKQTINTILKDFERKGYVKLSSSADDKRNKLIRLTPAGMDYAKSIIEELRAKELYVMQEIGTIRVREMNDSQELFIRLFNEKTQKG